MAQCPTRDTSIRSPQTTSDECQAVSSPDEAGILDQPLQVGSRSETTQKVCVQQKRRWTLLWHAHWTVPLHTALPIGLSWLIRNDPATAAIAFWAVHASFPLVLLATAPWWWNRKDELLVLLLINHLVSFVVLAFVPWW